MSRASACIVAALLASAAAAYADDPNGSGSDSAGDSDPAKREARALLREGVRLLGTGDNAGALALFRSAYAKFPSAKILLNIGSTLKTMGRAAEAANTYQAFLDAPDTDPSKTAEVEALLAQLDASLGRLVITADIADAEVRIDDGEWTPLAKAKLVRVNPGAYEVRAREAGVGESEQTGDVAAGATSTVTFVIQPARVEPSAPKSPAPPPAPIVPTTSAAIVARTQPSEPSRVGAVVAMLVEGKARGGAGLVGGSFAVHDNVAVEAGALLGPNKGAYAGSVAYLASGDLRPVVAAGMPIFFSSGARVGVRAAAGIEWRPSAHLGLTAELAVEHYFNPEADIDATQFVPLIGVRGWL